MGKKTNRRMLQFKTLEESLKEIHQLKETGYTKEGNWDLGQACQHLNKTMQMSFDGADFGLPFFVQPVVRIIFMRIVRKGKQLKAPAKAPSQLEPSGEVNMDEQIEKYEMLVKRLYEQESEIIPKHPIVGKLPPEGWRAFHAWHAAHHLSFLIPKETATAETP